MWRTEPLPDDWLAIRRVILERDGYRCTFVLHGERCTETTRLEVDHLGSPGDHRPEVLRTLCTTHHRWRTSSQGGKAAAARRRAPRRHEHPGSGTW